MKRLILILSMLASIPCLGQYNSAIRYRATTPTFYSAMDTLIARAALISFDTTEGGALNSLTHWKTYIGSRICNDVAVGEDMYSPLDAALKTYHSSFSSFCAPEGSGIWTCLGPFTSSYGPTSRECQGRIDAIWVHPNDTNFILAGSNGGGLWKSNNGGRTWRNITDGSGSSGSSVLGMAGVTAIAVSELDTNIIYIGLGGRDESKKSGWYTLGLAYTTDGGATWHTDTEFSDLVTTSHIPRVKKILYMPGTQQLYAISEGTILYKSSPSAPWSNISPSLLSTGNYSCRGMDFTKSGIIKLVVTTSAWADTSHMLIYNAGSWSDIAMGLPAPYSQPNDTTKGAGMISITSDNRAYIEFKAQCSGRDTSILVRTPLSSYTPEIRNHAFSCGNCNMSVQDFVVSPANPNLIYVANYSGWIDYRYTSTDSGATFWATGDNGHQDGRCIYLYSATSDPGGVHDVIYMGTDGGIRKKRYNDPEFKSITGEGLCITEFFGFGNTEADDEYITGGAQDVGGFAYVGSSANPWFRVMDGDGYSARFMKKGLTNAICEANNPSGPLHPLYTLMFSDTGVDNANLIIPDDIPVSNINRPLFIDTGNTAFVGYSHIWRKEYSDTVWSKPFIAGQPINISPGVTLSKRVVDFAMNNGNQDTVYIAYRDPKLGDGFGRLFVSKKAHHLTSPDWTDITPGIVDTDGINSIIIDPSNSARIWIALGNVNNKYVGASPDTMKYRVLYSSNFGVTWSDVSTGLSALPANKLLYRKGSDDELYLGTDAGVFKWNKTLGKWECYNLGLPSCTVMDMEFNYCAGKLRIATHGRGIWETDIEKIPEADIVPDKISTTTTWSNESWLERSVTVMPGATLTISNTTIHMPKDGKILVETGGKLIVDHSIITNDCRECLWQGIVAKGNSSVSQTPVSNQGWVTIKNNSTIQHAKIGVRNHSSDVVEYHSGGIIQVTNSTFRDCEMAADFAPYGAYSGSLLLPDVSYFYNVTFAIDGDYKGSMIPAVAAQAHLQEVNGVQFGACKFLNRTNRYVGDGIRAENAGFAVHPYCISAGAPCVTPQRSSFKGFVNGILVKQVGDYTAPVVSIDRTDFDSVSVGVNVLAQNNVAVTRCAFKIGRGPTVAVVPPVNSFVGCGRNVGILMQNARVFKMEDNDFKGRSNVVPMTPWYNIGTIVANSGATNSKVFRSTYDSLAAGVRVYVPVYVRERRGDYGEAGEGVDLEFGIGNLD